MKLLPAMFIALAIYAALVFIIPEILTWHR